MKSPTILPQQSPTRRQFLKAGTLAAGLAFSHECLPWGRVSTLLAHGREFILSRQTTRIVAPGGDKALGEQVADEISRRLRVTVPVIADSAVQETTWHSYDLIAIGNLQDNRVIARLYSAGKAFVDAAFPGSGGLFVKTLADPLGYGHSVVVVGGSDRNGTEGAVERFLSLISAEGARLAELHAVVSSFVTGAEPSAAEAEHNPIAKYEPALRTRSATPAGGDVARILATDRHNFDTGHGAQTLNNIIGYGVRFYFTNQPQWARLYRGALLDYIRLARERGGWDFDPMIGSFFRDYRMVEAWELIQRSEVFSAADRETISRAFLDIARYLSKNPLTSLEANPPGEPRQNHSTFLGLSLDAVARYFLRRGHPEAEVWEKIPLRIFEGQATSYHANDDAGGYAWYAPMHTFEFFERHVGDLDAREFLSRVGEVADGAIVVTDNRRDIVSYGDVGSYTPWSRVGWPETAAVFSRAVWAHHDPGHQWAYQWVTEGKKPPLGIQLYAVDSPSQEPKRLLGIHAMILDASAVRWVAARLGHIAWFPGEGVKYIDKISFRPSFNPADEYLLLDGTAAFSHGHDDANAITRLTWHDRVWLADMDYIRATPHYHNSIEVVRDGLTARVPPLAALRLEADLEQTGLVHSELPDYNGLDWNRHIFWVKGKYFVIFDRLGARRGGDYDLTCRWRVLGKVKVEEHRLEVTQPGAVFHLINADGAELSLQLDTPGVCNWSAYPYADGIVRSLIEKRRPTLRPGEQTWFINLLCAQEDAQLEAVQFRQAAEGVAVVERGSSVEVFGLAPEVKRLGSVEIQAEMFHLTPRALAAASVRYLECPAGRIRTSRGVNLQLGSDGKGKLIASGPTRLEMPATWKLSAPASNNGGLNEIELAAGTYALEFQPAEFFSPPELVELRYREPIPSIRKTVPPVNFGMSADWTVDAGDRVNALVPFRRGKVDGWLAGLEGGRVLVIDSAGKAQDCCRAGAAVRSLLQAGEKVIVGDFEGAVSAYDERGSLIWKRQLPPAYGRKQRIVKIRLQPHPQGDRLIVGTEGWRVNGFDLNGKLLWTTNIRYHAVTDLAVADLEGDGHHEIAVATEYCTPLNVLGPDGKMRWFTWEMVGEEVRSTTPYAGIHARIVRTAALERNSGPCILYGTETDNVYVFHPNGRLQWSSNVGGEVNGLAVDDFDGDSETEVAAGTSSGYLTLLDHRGNRRWWRRLPGGIAAVEKSLAGQAGDPVIVAGCDQGTLAVYTGRGDLVAAVEEKSPIAHLQMREPGKALAVTSSGRMTLWSIYPPRPDSHTYHY